MHYPSENVSIATFEQNWILQSTHYETSKYRHSIDHMDSIWRGFWKAFCLSHATFKTNSPRFWTSFGRLATTIIATTISAIIRFFTSNCQRIMFSVSRIVTLVMLRYAVKPVATSKFVTLPQTMNKCIGRVIVIWHFEVILHISSSWLKYSLSDDLSFKTIKIDSQEKLLCSHPQAIYSLFKGTNYIVKLWLRLIVVLVPWIFHRLHTKLVHIIYPVTPAAPPWWICLHHIESKSDSNNGSTVCRPLNSITPPIISDGW